jgi:hypothetical protein
MRMASWRSRGAAAGVRRRKRRASAVSVLRRRLLEAAQRTDTLQRREARPDP